MVELGFLSRKGPVSLEELAQNQGIPLRYLAKIVQDLKRAGFVKSVRGAHGGYLLAQEASHIKVLDIVRCLEGGLSPVECLNDASVCRRSVQCVTREVWAKVSEAIHNVLQSVSLQDLVDRCPKRNVAGIAPGTRRGGTT